MKNLVFIIILPIFLSGCLFLNERGVSTKYYNDCKEIYDATGTYKKVCDENLVNW